MAQLQGANLFGAQLQGADLTEAQLQGAVLGDAQLQGADLREAQLQGADLREAQLQGADLTEAQLRGADLMEAQLQGADFRGTALWRASLLGVRWDYADLRGANVQPMSGSDIEALVAEATKEIPDEERRTAVAETLNVALRTAERSPRPDFPEEWRSEPNVMFSAGGPEPERFDWGRPNWATEEEYDEHLATSLGDLACASDVPEATLGLARRAILASYPEPGRMWPKIFAARLIGPDCPPAKGLPDDMRRDLEKLAAELNREPAAAAAPETSPPDPSE